MTLFTTLPSQHIRLIPRDYQQNAHDRSFRLWDSGIRGTLTRMATGTGKTPLACLKMSTWLARGDNYRAMVVSYEQQLVWQFAQEVYDFLGITAGVEMESSVIEADALPQVVIASRQSLLRAPAPTPEQVLALQGYGVHELGAANARHCKRVLRKLSRGGEGALDEAQEFLAWVNSQPEAHGNYWSRLHKFDWRLNWLIVFDEAHRHAYKLQSVGHIVDWFDQNPESRRDGLTATPKRSDGVSIGDKMFPGVAIDYPFFHATKPCALRDGWAKPYVQRYIAVEGVDFKNIAKVKGDFDEAELERILGEEGQLAKLVQPLLDMVGDRRTLIFSPGVEMAKNVARFINARSEAVCQHCNHCAWYPSKLIGDGARCPCGAFIEPHYVTKSGEQALAIDGSTPVLERNEVYQAHQSGRVQFLSVCGLCREGYNDRDIACVAIFRPVSEAASSLAEQMKGRGCRPCSEVMPLLAKLSTPEERVEAIRNSRWPDCLIVDLVGVSGLEDCASTATIYAEGLPDRVAGRLGEILEEEAVDGNVNIEEAIRRAQEQIAEEDRQEAEARENRRRAAEEAERARREKQLAELEAREEAARRARADAAVTYTSSEMGVGANVPVDHDGASDGQMRFIAFLGMDLKKDVSRKQARRIINQLRIRTPINEVARLNALSLDDWEGVEPSDKQMKLMGWKGIPATRAKTPFDASQLIDAKLKPEEYREKKLGEIRDAKNGDELSAVGHDMKLVYGVLSETIWKEIVDAGTAKRAQWS